MKMQYKLKNKFVIKIFYYTNIKKGGPYTIHTPFLRRFFGNTNLFVGKHEMRENLYFLTHQSGTKLIRLFEWMKVTSSSVALTSSMTHLCASFFILTLLFQNEFELSEKRPTKKEKWENRVGQLLFRTKCFLLSI